ncbi:MAG: large conductance mechanosensitive channel protein MscL [Acidobacteria bacterium]|nr:MAG: large conductance mechanosensitive channel protein MscL [Acidobacteriota bacterium]
MIIGGGAGGGALIGAVAGGKKGAAVGATAGGIGGLIYDLTLVIGKPDFSALVLDVRGTKFPIGDFINAVLSFLFVAAAIYYFVVLPVNAIVARARRGEAPADPTTKKCPECLSEVPIAAKRCAFCTVAFS